jgi:hypothetical protein
VGAWEKGAKLGTNRPISLDSVQALRLIRSPGKPIAIGTSEHWTVFIRHSVRSDCTSFLSNRSRCVTQSSGQVGPQKVYYVKTTGSLPDMATIHMLEAETTLKTSRNHSRWQKQF